jgi:ankyrin repeat protein
VADGRTACLIALLKVAETDVNQCDGVGRSPLHLAANNTGVGCLTALVKQAGIKVNATDTKGTTPLHWAAVSNNVEACCVLSQYGADLGATDREGMTAEDHAVAQNFDHCAQALQDLEKNPMAHIEHVIASPKHSANRVNAWQSAIAKVKAQNLVRQSSANRRSSTCVIS